MLAALLLVRGARAGAGAGREEGPQDRLGAGPADPEPVRRPGRGELPDLGDQLRPARQLQPGRPVARARHRREAGTSRTDKKTVTFTLVDGAKWSDGEPITSKDVKYSLDVLGGNGLLFTSYTENVTSVETPDAQTVVIKTKKPDTRIVGGLFVFILPEHIWGKQTIKRAHGQLPAPDPAGRQRPVRGHRVRLQPDRADGAQPEVPRVGRSRSSTSSSSSSTAAPTPSSARSRSARPT